MVKLLLLFFKPVICHFLSYLFFAVCSFFNMFGLLPAFVTRKQGCVFLATHTQLRFIKTRSGMRDQEKASHTHTHLDIQTCTHAVCRHTHTRVPAANQTLLPLLTHTRRSLLLFSLRFLLPTWDWLAIRRCIYHICQLLSSYRSSSLLSQCEVPALKEFHSNVRCAYLENLTYCLVEWQTKWKWHRVLISCLFYLQHAGNIWQPSRFWNIKMLNECVFQIILKRGLFYQQDLQQFKT